ncbi:MAG: hypothetical protein PUC53_06985 [Bacteroidales bacterium]|nr:hypothetical protein [Bacteroidales bacterium]
MKGKNIEKSKGERIVTIYNWTRLILLIIFVLLLYLGVTYNS